MSKEIKIQTKKLKEAVQLSSLTTSKEKGNILSNTVIEIKNDKIILTSKNATTKSLQSINTETQNENFTFLVNPNLLFNIVKELKETTTYFIPDQKTLTIKNGKFTTKIKTMNKELYPYEQEDEKKFITKIEFNKIKHLMKSTSTYPDKNDIAREYTGVLIEVEEEKLKATATDHYRLINVTTPTKNSSVYEKFIIENNGAALIAKIDMEDSVELLKSKQKIELREGEKSIESKIIQGEFPDYQEILLSENESFIKVDKDELFGSIKRVSITNTEDEITFEINSNNKTVNISSQNIEGEESQDSLDIKETNTQNDIKIKLNSRFFINFLSQINSEDVYIYYRSSDEPIMLKSQETDYVYNYIMTPIID